jgi:glycerol-1-phosphate dehydrogenase [NAD(P)+]
MPLLARTLTGPLFVDIRPGAVSTLAELLTERRISRGGEVMVAVGSGQGEKIWDLVAGSLPNARVHQILGGSIDDAAELRQALRDGSFDAVVGIGGGRTLDVAKYAATPVAIPMIAVATNLSHDGICSPVSSLLHPGGKGSFGVAMPLGVVIDLDFVRAAPVRMVRSGIGDAVSNLSAVADWRLAAQIRKEEVDGLAVVFARTAGEAVLNGIGPLYDDDVLTTLAEARGLSGMAMSVAGTSRPCSGACHEIIHAVEAMDPGLATHGELAGVGALFASYLRGDPSLFGRIADCLARFELPRVPSDLGMPADAFTDAVLAAPATRPDRYTILEHLNLDRSATRYRVDSYVAAVESRPR